MDAQKQSIVDATDSFFRMMQSFSGYTIVPYWTRLPAGVRDKRTKKQVWATTSATPLDFKDKLNLANMVATGNN